MNTLIKFLPYIQIILSIFLVIGILLQQRGAGLGSTFGGGGGMGYSTKRGAEKVVFYFTVVIAILFIAAAILAVKLG